MVHCFALFFSAVSLRVRVIASACAFPSLFSFCTYLSTYNICCTRQHYLSLHRTRHGAAGWGARSLRVTVPPPAARSHPHTGYETGVAIGCRTLRCGSHAPWACRKRVNNVRLHQPTYARPWRAAGARAHRRAHEDTNTVPGYSYQRSAARPPWKTPWKTQWNIFPRAYSTPRRGHTTARMERSP